MTDCYYHLRQYAVLTHAAAAKSGEMVLLHAAAGGVGLAALQGCRAAGASVFATAGGPAKRALLRGEGVAAVASSRDLGFVEVGALVAVTPGGGGAHVALNTLTSPGMVAATLASMRTGGGYLY